MAGCCRALIILLMISCINSTKTMEPENKKISSLTKLLRDSKDKDPVKPKKPTLAALGAKTQFDLCWKAIEEIKPDKFEINFGSAIDPYTCYAEYDLSLQDKVLAVKQELNNSPSKIVGDPRYTYLARILSTILKRKDKRDINK